MADSIAAIMFFVFVATLPARMPAFPTVFNRPVLRAALVSRPPLWFITPDPIYLLNARCSREEPISRGQSLAELPRSIEPAWKCLLLICLVCLHTELNRSVIASYVWREFIRQTSIVFVIVLCLVAYTHKTHFADGSKPNAKLLIALLVSAVVLISVGAL